MIEKKLTANISYDEAKCPCCNLCNADSKFLKAIQSARTTLGHEFIFNSFYRCTSHNEAVGGVRGSYHTKGLACDISCKGWSGSKKARFVRFMLNTGLSVLAYDSFFHIDMRHSPIFLYGK